MTWRKLSTRIDDLKGSINRILNNRADSRRCCPPTTHYRLHRKKTAERHRKTTGRSPNRNPTTPRKDRSNAKHPIITLSRCSMNQCLLSPSRFPVVFITFHASRTCRPAGAGWLIDALGFAVAQPNLRSVGGASCPDATRCIRLIRYSDN